MLGREHLHHSPLPGTAPPNRGLFIDRWGTLFEQPDSEFCTSLDQVRFTPGVLEALFRASQARWSLYLIGNEDAVAQGRFPEARWKSLEGEIHAELARHGISFRRNYTCISDPEKGVGALCKDSVYRLPNTGPFYHAAHTDSMVLDHCWVIGDSSLELVAGWRAGCKTLGLSSGAGVKDGTYQVDPDLHAADLSDAVQSLICLANAA